MMLHEKGAKAERDRAILINSYEAMCDEFRLPAAKRLSRADMARMSNAAIYRASKDVYSQASVKQANKLAVKMGLKEKSPSWLDLVFTEISLSFMKALFGKRKNSGNAIVTYVDPVNKTITIKPEGANHAKAQ